MKRKYLYLPIEIKVRELWPKVWLASHVAKRNFICVLGDKVGVKAAMKVYPPGIFFDKSLSINKHDKLSQILNRQHAIVAQDEEAGIARTEIGPFFDIRISEQNLHLASRFYCWGNNDYRHICDKYDQYSERVRLTGSPRIDLWRPNICDVVYKETIENIRRKFGDFILINSSFGITSEAEIHKRMNQALEYGNISTDTRSSKRNELEQRLREFKNFSEMVHHVAGSRPKLNFVIRPHPSESMRDWENAVGKMDNLFLLREGEVTPWLSACRVLVHEGCTTGLQATLMGKPAISYVPKSLQSGHEKLNDFPNLVSHTTRSVEELLQALDMVASGGGFGSVERRKHLELIGSRIANINGKYAAELIAEDLDTLAIPAYSRPSAAKIVLKKQYSRIQGLMDKFLHIKNGKKKRLSSRNPDEKIPGGIGQDELETFLKRLERVDSELGTMRVSRIGKNVFEIFKGN